MRSSKTDQLGKKNFYFTITKSNDEEACPYEIVKLYIDSVSKKTGRFFRNYNVKSKKLSDQPMGRNIIGDVPKFIANFLEIRNAECYTGHCFRRSSATALADAGASLSSLKRQFRWKSDSVAQSYIDQSMTHKIDVANSLNIHVEDAKKSKKENEPSSTKSVISNCSNVVINL